MTYEAWRITYQSSEQAARAAYSKVEELAKRVAELESELFAWRDKYMFQCGQFDSLKEVATALAADRSEREKQKPVFWYRLHSDGQGYDGPIHDSQIEPVRRESGAWVPLFAGPLVTAPVRLTDEHVETVARNHGTGGWQTLASMASFARAIETAVFRANGFKIDHPEHALELVGLRGCNSTKKFNLGDLVRKKSGAEFEGRVVGEYSTGLTPEGYAVESIAHKYTVQIYPAAALELIQPSEAGG